MNFCEFEKKYKILTVFYQQYFEVIEAYELFFNYCFKYITTNSFILQNLNLTNTNFKIIPTSYAKIITFHDKTKKYNNANLHRHKINKITHEILILSNSYPEILSSGAIRYAISQEAPISNKLDSMLQYVNLNLSSWEENNYNSKELIVVKLTNEPYTFGFVFKETFLKIFFDFDKIYNFIEKTFSKYVDKTNNDIELIDELKLHTVEFMKNSNNLKERIFIQLDLDNKYIFSQKNNHSFKSFSFNQDIIKFILEEGIIGIQLTDKIKYATEVLDHYIKNI